MTRAVDGLAQIADTFDVAVLDQWGVLHDGATPYPHAAAALRSLHAAGKRILVLSNSGKRSDVNLDRISGMGLPVRDIEVVMTSGEALWRDANECALAPFSRPLVISGTEGDAELWADGLAIEFAGEIAEADSLLVMGLPEGADVAAYEPILNEAQCRGLTLICSNPDRSSPRPGGASTPQPGALAAAYEERGGTVVWYGKPYGPIFRAVERFTGVAAERHLMVGDSPEHDIAGGAAAGWRTAFIRGGLHARALRPGTQAQVERISAQHGAPMPDVHLETLRW